VWTNTVCTEDNDIVVIGKEGLSAEPERPLFDAEQRPGRSRPDLRYFEEAKK